jgi:hypothetical protein
MAIGVKAIFATMAIGGFTCFLILFFKTRSFYLPATSGEQLSSLRVIFRK